MNSRTFTILTAGSVADPAHQIKVVEIVDHNGFKDHIQYASTQVIRDLIDKMDEDAIRAAQDIETRQEVLKLLGVSHDDYIRKVRESYERAEVSNG